jgi:hypothetical protein
MREAEEVGGNKPKKPPAKARKQKRIGSQPRSRLKTEKEVKEK